MSSIPRFLVAPVCFLILLCPALGQENPTKPNIIFVLVDDLGWGDLGLNHQNQKSGKRHFTPSLDRMAREGVRLLRHYCPAPVCAPSRSSLLSGLHQGHANVRDNQFDRALADNHTLGTVLQTAGYRTVLVGKYGLQGKVARGQGDPSSWSAYPTKRGFDEFFGYVRHADGHQHYPGDAWPLGNSEGHRSPKELWHNDQEISGDLEKCFTVDLFTAYAKRWIAEHRRAASGQPFFMYLAHDTPHAALQLATGPYPPGGGLGGGVQWLGEPGRMINTAEGVIDSYVHTDYRQAHWADEERRFASLVRRVDRSMGDLLQLLRDLEIAENTLVVFTSDNGPHSESYIQGKNYHPTSFQSYGPMDGMKRDVWEGGIRVPTLAWWPQSIPAGSEDRRPSQFHDWMATFAQAAGVPVPALSDGVSLLPRLRGEGQGAPSTVYVEYNQRGATPNYADYASERQRRRRGQMQVLFMEGYKGVRTNIRDPQQDFEIYEVEADPGERRNLSPTSDEFRALNQRMKARVLQGRRVSLEAPRPYDGEAVPGVEAALRAGFDWETFAGEFPWVPREPGQGGQASVVSDGLEVSLPARALSIGKGYLRVPEEGELALRLSTRGRAVVRLHQAILFDADFGFDGGTKETRLPLRAGDHPLTVWVLGGEEETDFELQWSKGGDDWEAIPAEAIFRSEAD